MKPTTRRDFLKHGMVGAAALGLPTLALGADRPAKGTAANSAVRLGIIGMGAVDAVGGVGGRGHQLIHALEKVPAARIVALCDADTAFLDRETAALKKRGQEVATYTDLRKLLDNPAIDAVIVALPNHWHSLATIWACQAGKDVYVEKPFSYNIWEGRQAVAAARKHRRVVQVGMQSRSSPALRQAFEYLRSGQLGPIRSARAIVYRARQGIGRAGGPPPVPPTLDLDLWCGPASTTLPIRKQLHYDWHWFWETGNGEVGNNGIHVVDVARWALGQDQPAPRAISVGGRFAFDDDGETANTLVAVLDYRPAPLILEVRNLRLVKQPDSLGAYRGRTGGVIVDCEGGYYVGDSTGGTVFDRQGRKMPVKEIPTPAWRPIPTRPTWPTSPRPLATAASPVWPPRHRRDMPPWPAATWPMFPTGWASRPRRRRSSTRCAASPSCTTPSSVAASTCGPTASIRPRRRRRWAPG